MNLSLCMIVKNEEDCMDRCLKSLKGTVDEIIIVDTGSTDKTIEICRSFGAEVYSFPWNGSFAEARNYGIERAKGDWILWLDADEAIEEQDVPKLKELNQISEQYDMLSILLLNYYGDEVDPYNVSQIAQVRLFRNHRGHRFQNDIHEILPIQDMERVSSLDLTIHHYGYLNRYVEEKKKSKRNIELLETKAAQTDDGWTQFYLSMEYYRIQQYAKAFEHANDSIRKFLEQKQLPPSMVYKLKYAIMIDLKSWDEALEGIKRVILLYPDYVDIWYYMGFVLYQKEKYLQAIRAFENCIALGEENLDYYIVKGVGSFLAWHYKALCLKKLGHSEEAVDCFLTLLDTYDAYPPAVEELASMIKEQNISFEQWSQLHGEEHEKGIQHLLNFMAQAN